MKIIVGLGNPGREYENTRHNVGWRVLDEMVKNPQLAPVVDGLEFHEKKDFFAEIVEINRGGEKIILVKSLTFMNDSGRAVQAIRHFYKIEAKDVWVACDDIDLPVGMIRVRLEGSSGGHNGLKSIIEALSTEQFARVRLGIGQTTGQNQKEFENYISEDRNSAERSSHQPSVEAKQFVLSPFGEREAEIVKKAIEKAAEIIIDALGKKEGLEGHTYEVG